MNRPTKIRMVYQELRAVLGDEFSAKEALQSAALLVEIAEKEADFGASTNGAPPTFDELPVDVALADGGWRILSRDKALRRAQFEDEEVKVGKPITFETYGLGLAA